MSGPASSAADELHAEIARGQRLDRDLARDLGRHEPVRSGAAGDYVEALGRRPPLSQDAERRLVAAAKRGDAAARGKLIDAFMPLIAGTARTYRSGRVQRLELLQEGIVGLLRALERFEADRGVPFWAYATWWVRQAMQQLVAELTRPVVLSDRALRHLARIKQAHRDAVQETGREPTREELARRAALSLEQVDELLATERAPRSLEEPVGGDGEDIGTFGELLSDPLAEDAYERVLAEIEIAELHALLAGLGDREREVLRARYGLDGEELSLRSVGDRLGLSGERVRQIERRALGKLGAAATGEPQAAA
ncbi:MAG TPA: sigma-70 family RNA polymerase sigma factor [Solirubrobacteraceae bacterium]|nr:sigma-70 family RNA polymerase sigma factor [Solirubrobacteraceae bacterium]